MKRAAFAVLAISVLGATAALADSRHGHDDDRGRYDRRHDDGRDHGRRDDRRWDDRRDHDRRSDHRRDDDHRWHHGYRSRNDFRHYDRFRAGKYHAPPGYRHRHWGRGDRLPRAYYARPYVIANYHSYRLRPPPRGCHYVRVNNDVVLAAIATGVILDVFYNHFY